MKKGRVGITTLKAYDFGIHIPLDDRREWIVSSIAHPRRELRNREAVSDRKRSGTDMTIAYADVGYVVTVDDDIPPQATDAIFEDAPALRRRYKLLLRASLETTLARNRSRTNTSFDMSV